MIAMRELPPGHGSPAAAAAVMHVSAFVWPIHGRRATISGKAMTSRCQPPWRRSIRAHALPVCWPGRWGPRRVRVGECPRTLRAEDLYTNLLRDNAAAVVPGRAGEVTFSVAGRSLTAAWEIRRNAVWRRGRVFLRCPRCGGRCTRLYLPRADAGLACRRCWGLTYTSRTRQNYNDSPWGRGALARMWGETQREAAMLATVERRREQRERSRERWAERRQYRKTPADAGQRPSDRRENPYRVRRSGQGSNQPCGETMRQPRLRQQ